MRYQTTGKYVLLKPFRLWYVIISTHRIAECSNCTSSDININKQTNTNIQAELVIEIFTSTSMLLVGHQLNQLTKPHKNLIKIFLVWPAVDSI